MRRAARRRRESGNVIFYVLLGVVLVGLVTAAMRMSGMGSANIDKENVLIRASQVRQNAQELERAVTYIMQNGASETDIRFANPSIAAYGDITNVPARQAFAEAGGGAEYRRPPAGINDGSTWEFYGHTAFPGVASPRPDLAAVLPNVTKEFCDRINAMNNQTAAPAEAGGGCVHDTNFRFNDGTQFQDGAENVLNETAASFSVTPAMQACVDCNPGGPVHSYHFYHVLLAR